MCGIFCSFMCWHNTFEFTDHSLLGLFFVSCLCCKWYRWCRKTTITKQQKKHVWDIFHTKLMKGKALRKHSLHEKTAASVLLKTDCSLLRNRSVSQQYFCWEFMHLLFYFREKVFSISFAFQPLFQLTCMFNNGQCQYLFWNTVLLAIK